MGRWHHANAARSRAKMMRRAVYLCRIQCGERPMVVQRQLGISRQTAKRYMDQST